MATENITVDIGGKEHVIYREEILRCDDKLLKDTFVIREATQSDLNEAQMKVHQLKHALSSLDNTLQQASVRYIAAKFKPAEESEPPEPNTSGDVSNE